MNSALRNELLLNIVNQSTKAALGFWVMAVLCIVTGLFSDQYAVAIRWFCAGTIVVNIFRLMTAAWWKRNDGEQEKYWPLFVTVTALNGLLWGLALGCAIYDDRASMWAMLMSFTIYTAYCNGSISTLSNDLKVHVAFMLGISLPLVAAMLLRYQASRETFYLVEALFVVIIIVYCLSQGRTFRKNFIQRWETDAALKQSQQDLLDQRALTEHMNRLSAIGEMAAGFAHEINNPLAIVIGNLDILETDLKDKRVLDEETKRIIQKMTTSAMRIAKIIKGVRTLSRETAAEGKSPHPVAAILEDTLILFEQRFSAEKIEFTKDIDASLILTCDPVQIGQVLMNLLSNACDVLAAQPPATKRWIKFRARALDQALEIEVTNSGPSITKEVQEKIFTPFFTTRPVGQGMGLGLVVSRSIATQHGGSLEVDTEAGHTRFTLKLPR